MKNPDLAGVLEKGLPCAPPDRAVAQEKCRIAAAFDGIWMVGVRGFEPPASTSRT